MTAPAALLNAIVAGIAAIPVGATPTPTLGQQVDVREYEGDFDDDNKDFKATKNMAVLVSLLGWKDSGQDLEPPTVDATLVALCISKIVRTASGESTKSDVAAALAATVHRRLAAGERWGGLAAKAATNVQVSNEHSNKQFRKGLSVWSLAWRQRFELDLVGGGALNDLSIIHTTFAMGDDHTPDAVSQIDFP